MDDADLDAAFHRLGSFAVEVLVSGESVYRFGRVSTPFRCASLRKSLLNAVVGGAVDRGLLGIEATLEDLAVDDLQPLTVTERRATVRDLLMGRSGVFHPAASQGVEALAFPRRHTKAPGEVWAYNNWDFNALGTIVAAAADADLFDLFGAWIAEPIGMEDFDPALCANRFEPVSRHGAYKMRMSALDLVRFGQLFLQVGRWGSVEVVSPRWVTESLTPWTPTAETGYPFGGFGYLWWIGPTADFGPRRHFSAHGGTANALLVFPDADMVMVHANRDTPDGRSTGSEPRWHEVAPVIAALVSSVEARRFRG